MLKLDDFAKIFCLTKSSIEKKVRPLLPILKNFDPVKRKTRYTIQEANAVIKHIGLPPDTEFNRNLKSKFPDLFL